MHVSNGVLIALGVPVGIVATGILVLGIGNLCSTLMAARHQRKSRGSGK